MSDARVVVIGSGPAGAAAARALVARGIDVTLLESGLDLPARLHLRALGQEVLPPGSPPEDDLPFVAAGDPKTRWLTTHAPGGLSRFWTLQTTRFDPHDLTDGARLDRRYAWPIAYADLVPWYEHVERLLAISGSDVDVPALPACTVADRRIFPDDWRAVAARACDAGEGLVPRPVVRGARWSVGRAGTAWNSYRDLLLPLATRAADRLRVVLGAHVVHLGWDGRRVTHAIYIDRTTRTERRVDGAAFVIAGGPLGTTRLLLASTSRDFPEGLGNAHGVLGRYLHDHPMRRGVLRLEARPLTRIPFGAYLARAPYARSAPLLGAAAMMQNVTVLRSLRRGRPEGARTSALGYWILASMVPEDRVGVRLHPTRTDAFGLPAIVVDLRHREDARGAAAEARERMLDRLYAAGHAPTLESDAAMPPGESAHFGGTARMHEDPRYGMVDGWNRVHAARNVIVADASVWTTAAEKNPTLTVMAMAMRAADRLARDLKGGEVAS